MSTVKKSSTPIVAIIGRPNVGKSTLFNRIAGKRISIVDKSPGTTIDRIMAEVYWNGKKLFFVDTAGFLLDPRDELEKEIMESVKAAVRDASLIVFVVDREVLPIDKAIADQLRKSASKVVFVANKFDDPSKDASLSEFFPLGFGEPITISALHGHNVAELLDRIVESIPEISDTNGAEDRIRIAVVGRANVGKSTYINTLLNSKRVIVSPIPGTTRDPVEVYFNRGNTNFILVDTGGIRKTKDPISFYSVIRTLRVINKADVVLHLVDARDGFTSFDKRISRIALQSYRGLVIGVNKWDIMPKDEKVKTIYREGIYSRAPYLYFVPVVFLSALTGYNVLKTLDLLKEVSDVSRIKIKTSDLNEFLYKLTRQRQIPSKEGKQIKFFYATQIDGPCLSFVLFMKNARYVKQNYAAFLEKKIRNEFGLKGVPIKLHFRNKK